MTRTNARPWRDVVVSSSAIPPAGMVRPFHPLDAEVTMTATVTKAPFSFALQAIRAARSGSPLPAFPDGEFAPASSLNISEARVLPGKQIACGSGDREKLTAMKNNFGWQLGNPGNPGAFGSGRRFSVTAGTIDSVHLSPGGER